MLLTEYNERQYIKMFRKEAREEGLAEGRKQGLAEGNLAGQRRLLATMLQNGVPAEQLSEWTGLPLSEIRQAQENLKSHDCL